MSVGQMESLELVLGVIDPPRPLVVVFWMCLRLVDYVQGVGEMLRTIQGESSVVEFVG